MYKEKRFCYSTGEGGGSPIWIEPPPGSFPKNRTSSEEPGLYPELLTDFSVISFIHGVAGNIADPIVRDAMKKGAEAAAHVLKQRGGPDVVSVSFAEKTHGASA
jgi:hypothetical protein